MIKSVNIGRISAFFIALMLSFNGLAVEVHRNDFETGRINSPLSNQTDAAWISSTTKPDTQGNCIATSSYDANNSNKVVTSEKRAGAYGNSQTIYWECDYRLFNGGDTVLAAGKQKPRNAVSINNSADWMVVGTEYWFTFSYKLPSDWVTDRLETNLYQLHKMEGPSRKSKAGMFIIEESNVTTFGFSGINGNHEVEGETLYSFPTVKNDWNDVIVHLKPCASGADSCGIYDVYLSNTARRAAGTELTPIFTDVGPNTEYSTTKYRQTVNVYKYNWHCLSANSGNYATCMQDPPSSGTDTYVDALGKALPITVYFDNVITYTATNPTISTIAQAVSTMAPWFSSGPSTPVGVEVTSVNSNQPLGINDYAFFTGNNVDFRGVTNVDITDGTNTETATGWTSNLNGGCFTLGALNTVNGGDVTLGFDYDAPTYDSEEGAPTYTSKLADWVPFNATITPITGTDACYNKGGAVKVSNSAGTSLIDMETVDEIDGIVANDTLTARVVIEPSITNTVNNYRVRIQCDSGQLQATGALGSMALTTTTLGSAAPIVQTQDRGFTFIKLKTTAGVSDNNCQVKVGANESGTKDFNLYHVTFNKNESTTRVTYNTILNKTDVQAPSFIEHDISAITTTSVNLLFSVNEASTVYAVVTGSATAPSVAQVKAGLADTGVAAQAATSRGSVANSSDSFTAENLDPYVDKYVYFVATDSSANDSTVITGDTHITGEPLVVKVLQLGTIDNLIKNNGGAVTGTFDTVVVWDGNPVIGPSKTILAEFENVAITAGIAELTESDLKAGSPSLNAIEAGDYWVTTTRINPSTGVLAITNSQKSIVLQ